MKMKFFGVLVLVCLNICCVNSYRNKYKEQLWGDTTLRPIGIHNVLVESSWATVKTNTFTFPEVSSLFLNTNK